MILLGLTGSVASVLAKKIIQELQTIDSQVEVVVTEKTKAFCNVPSYTDRDEWTWPRGSEEPLTRVETKRTCWKKDDPILHIELGKKADVLVIAPLSANTMAKLANGICDNLLTSIVRAWDIRKPIFLAPAMNTQMWIHPITKRHCDILSGFGYRIIEPQTKLLACGDEGIGAMADIENITQRILIEKCPEDKWLFPLRKGNGIPINPHPGAFGYSRKGRQHTGIDLYTEDGAPVYACESGRVVCIEHFTGEWDNSPWWNNTDCILVRSDYNTICYGEIVTDKKVGDIVEKGQLIARVKRVIKEGRERPEITGHSPSMLHLELYPRDIVRPSAGFESFLQDPTPFLLDSYNRPIQCLVYDRFQNG